jgi:hypothetical protein
VQVAGLFHFPSLAQLSRFRLSQGTIMQMLRLDKAERELETLYLQP